MRMLKTNQSETMQKVRASISTAVDGVVYAQDFVIWVKNYLFAAVVGLQPICHTQLRAWTDVPTE